MCVGHFQISHAPVPAPMRQTRCTIHPPYKAHPQPSYLSVLRPRDVAAKSNWPFGAAVSFILMTATLVLTAAANLMVQRRYRN